MAADIARLARAEVQPRTPDAGVVNTLDIRAHGSGADPTDKYVLTLPTRLSLSQRTSVWSPL